MLYHRKNKNNKAYEELINKSPGIDIKERSLDIDH